MPGVLYTGDLTHSHGIVKPCHGHNGRIFSIIRGFVEMGDIRLQVKCLKFKVPKVPKVKVTKMTITCFGPVLLV